MSVTIKDVARLAGVSVGTASMAVNGKPGVNAETKARVLAAAGQLDYYPNQAARNLIHRKTSTLGLIVTDITNPFFAGIVDEVRQAAEQAGFKLILGVSGDRTGEERRYVAEFVEQGIEGLIVVPVAEREPDLSHLRRLRKLGIPFVYLSTAYRALPAPCAMTDLAAGVDALVGYLLDCGHRRICFLTGQPDLMLTLNRTEGYARAYAARGLTWEPDWLMPAYPDFQHGYAAADRIVSAGQPLPDAIITVNDIMAMGVLKALKDRGCQVPDDISVAGFDDLIYSALLETPLTTVRQPVPALCRMAVGILLELIQGRSGDSRLIEPELVIRQSTGCRSRPK